MIFVNILGSFIVQNRSLYMHMVVYSMLHNIVYSVVLFVYRKAN